MDVLNTLATITPITWLLIAGIFLLVVNIIYGWFRSTRDNIKAGWFTVCLALVACVMIGVGAVQAASAAVAAPRAGQFAGRGGGFNNQANGTGSNASASSTAGVVPVSDSNANDAPSQASTPDGTNATPQPAGTPGRGARGNRTPGAAGGSPTGSGQGGAPGGTNTFSGGQRGANAPGGTQAAAGQSDQTTLQIALIGGGLCLLLALMLYFAERRRTGFVLASSRGLLNLGAASFILVAALVIPLISAQNAAAAAAVRFAGAGNFRARVVSPTPSSTPPYTATASMMPSLTPAPTDTPMAMPTEIAYASTYTVNMAKSVCSANANTAISLRADPSTKQPAIGRLVGGSLLNVIQRSADGQWLDVITSDTGVEGWVSASFVTLGSSCQSIPGSTGTTTTSPPPTPKSAATTPAYTQAVLVTPMPCTLLTTTAASLRPDPSLSHTPLASIPEKTVLTPIAKSTNGWWQVKYGNLEGWIGAATVFASSSCSSVPTATASS